MKEIVCILPRTEVRIAWREDMDPQISQVQRNLAPFSSKPYTSNLFGLATTRWSTSSESKLHFIECKIEDGGKKVDTTRMIVDEFQGEH